MRKIFVSDHTLKTLGKERKLGLLFRQKAAIAKCLETCGINCIELEAVKNPVEDAIIGKTISGAAENCHIAIPVGEGEDGAKTAWECISTAKLPRLQVCLPVSTVQMEYRYHVKDAGMLKMIAAYCKAAYELCGDVEFIAADATRADIGFLTEACRTAKENGAGIVTLCDDAGVCLPEEFADIVREVREKTDLTVYVKPSDCIGLANACVFAAIKAGAEGVKTAVTGSDVLLTERFASAVRARGDDIGITTSLCQTELYRDIDKMLRKVEEPKNKDGEGNKSKIFLDGSSTASQVGEAVAALGYEISEEDIGKVHDAVRRVCEKKHSVGGRELEAIIATSAMQVPSTFHLESYLTTTGSLSAVSRVTLISGDEKLVGSADGDGPIDSSFKAIEQCVGHRYELDDFQIQSVTEGKEALGSALVRLRYDGKLYSGSGISADIVGASIRAYLNALNKIVYENR